MRPISNNELAALLEGQLDEERGGHVYGFATDHREAKAGDAFLAIRGARFDGHLFVQDAVKHGAVVAIVERPVSAPHILVPNLVEALAKMAGKLRDGFHGPVIGVTGSAGKTTTKEFIAAALSPLGKVLKSEGNQNTEYTAPLTWPRLESDTAAVVAEMAMRGFGQIRQLASFIRPTIVVVTNIGYSHMEMVKDREGIARAKGEAIESLPDDGVAILWAEDDFLEGLRSLAGPRRVRTFGFSEQAHCRITDYQIRDWSSADIAGTLDGAEWHATLPVIGRHIALNAAAAVLAANEAGVTVEEAAAQIQNAILPAMRMEVRDLKGARVLLDTYNASPPSMTAAIEALLQLPVAGRRLAVLGDMRELGAQSETLHRRLGASLGSLHGVLFYGEAMEHFALPEARRFGLGDARVAHSLDDVAQFLRSVREGDAVLVKGSRALELERALDLVDG